MNTASNATDIEQSPRRAPWWSWSVPPCLFLLCLTIFWPANYAMPAGDGWAYYSGARHIAAEGRYYDDYSARPAVPLVRHPPLFSILWGALLYVGVSPTLALWLIHAMFLGGMAAAGGALAYHITRSWQGPLLWTLFSCCWPGGDNWVYWVRPQTETGTAALFVIVCWLLAGALRACGGRSIAWLLLASVLAGLSMILKVTGAFCFPVVGLVSLIILRRGRAWSRWWVVISSGLLMLLPYGVWAARNLALSGTVEAGKIDHVPELFLALLANTAADAATWFLPSQLAGRLCNSVHPLLIMVPLVVLPLWLTIRALRNRQPEAALPGACAAIAFGALGVMMITKFTEETRYWSVMLPSLALAVLALRPPAHKLGGQVFRILAVLFAMFCGVRFGITRSYLWYAGPLGFYLQQGFLAASIVGGSLYLHRSIRELWQQSNCRKAHLAGMAVSGIVAVGLWWFGHEHDQVAISAFVPLLLIGAFISLPLGQAGRGELLRCLACLLPIALSWGLGGWSWVEQPQPLTYKIDNILVQVRPDVDRARRILAEGEWPAKFVSNCEEYLIDLFGDHSVIPLPWYRSIARFRGQLPQLPEDAALVKREWLEALRRDGITEPFVMVMFPQFAARAYFYGPADFESEPQLDIEWRLRDDDLHLAICRLVR